MTSLIGRKVQQGQKFLENGTRIPVTYVDVAGNTIVSVKTADKNNYFAIQLGMGIKKKASKALLGHAKGAGLETAPYFLREIRIDGKESESLPNPGDKLNPSEVFQPGDVINVTGTSKGKGFAGGVKRYGFHGGPKTHGQSDRHRAPGSIGQGTTPGRVYKGKKMAGRMGNEQVTVRNLKIVEVTPEQILIEGLVPGVLGSYIVINKIGEDKKFIPLYKEPIAADVAPAEESEAQTATDEAKVAKEATKEPQEPQEEVQAPGAKEVGKKEEIKEEDNAQS